MVSDPGARAAGGICGGRGWGRGSRRRVRSARVCGPAAGSRPGLPRPPARLLHSFARSLCASSVPGTRPGSGCRGGPGGPVLAGGLHSPGRLRTRGDESSTGKVKVTSASVCSEVPATTGWGGGTSREDCGKGLLGEVTSELLEVLKGRCPSGRGRSKGPEKKPLLVAERGTEARAL